MFQKIPCQQMENFMVKILFLLSTVLFAGDIAKATNKLTLTGSSTLAPLVSEIAKLFEKNNPGLRIDVQTGGTSRGISDTLQGTVDIGMISRALKPEEKKLSSFTIANDGICIIIHKSNSITSLTHEQVIGIYTGKIKNWKEVAGADAPITVVNKAEGRSTLELFLHYFNLKASEIKSSVIIGDNEQGVKTVSGNPNSIGYVSIGTAEFNFQNKVSIKLLPLDGVEASTENVRNGNFPLSRPLNLVTKTKPIGDIKNFIDFAQSKEVYETIKQLYFVPHAK